MASEALATIVAALRARPPRTDLSWAERRRQMEEWQAGLALPDDVRVEPVDAHGVPAEWIDTPGASAQRVILYLHGGGYCMGSIATHRHLMQRIGRAAGARVLGVDYRLGPEHPFPAAVEDAVAAYRFLLASGVDPRAVAIAGDSAGGGLTIAALLALRDRGEPMPGAAVGLSPWTDLAGTGDSIRTKAALDPMVTADALALMARSYLDGADPRNPLASPLFADLSVLPPLLLQVGSAEILLDDATRRAERGRAAGVTVELEAWDEMIHVFQAFPMLAESGKAIDRIGGFLRRHLVQIK